MDFKDYIKQLSERVSKLKDQIQTEEATKNAFIMPFIQMLGYDIFNPIEVVPEMTCDIGTKKGEKIDYAIIRDDKPSILIECKHWKQNLDLHDGQLLRYYHVSAAKFGILTNGIKYRFYTDLVEPNKMDEVPFLELDLENLRENQIEEVKKFHKSYFDVENILSSASELKYTSEFKSTIQKEFANPSPEFVKLIAKKSYDGMITSKILEQFTDLIKRSISNHINDIISERLNIAIKSGDNKFDEEKVPAMPVPAEEVNENNVVTTEEELNAFYIVKAIVRNSIPVDRITYRDAQTYFAIFVDNNNRKPICRLYLNSPTNKQLALFDENKKEIKYKIASIDEIYTYADQLLTAIEKYKE